MCSLGRILFFILLLLLFVGSGQTPAFAFSQDVKDAQVLLNSLGFDAGSEDGISGAKTKAALSEFYASQEKTFDGFLSENELVDLMNFLDAQAQQKGNEVKVSSEVNPYVMPILVVLGAFIFILWVASKSKRSNYAPHSAPLSSGQPTLKSIQERIAEPEPTLRPHPEPIEKAIQPIVGKCHVIDGDTIVIGKQHIRFAGMNAPELNEPYGKQAKWALVELCKGQVITAHPNGETSYDRIVAKCFLPDGRDLAAEMVKMELALDIPHFPDADYKHLETPNSRRKLRWRPKKKDPTD